MENVNASTKLVRDRWELFKRDVQLVRVLYLSYFLADGYVRAEGIVVCLLQRKEDARRLYAHVMHAKTNVDGYKEEGIHYPSSKMQAQLLTEVYSECGVDPAQVKFMEAHATGTKVSNYNSNNYKWNYRRINHIKSCKSYSRQETPRSYAPYSRYFWKIERSRWK